MTNLDLKKLKVSYNYFLSSIYNLINKMDNSNSIGSVTSSLLYNLSKYYDVIILKKGTSLELLLDYECPKITSHDIIQYTFTSFIADGYIKYNKQNVNVDLRLSVLPVIDVIKYNCSSDKDFVNLPNKINKEITIYNSDIEYGLVLTPQQYVDYIKIHPKYLYKHKYIKMENNKFVPDIIKYCIDKYTDESKYYFTVRAKCLIISSSKTAVYNIPFTTETVNNFIDQVIEAIYRPISITNIIDEAEEVKKIISILNVKLEVRFLYL